MKTQSLFKAALGITASILMLSSVAIINGYPLVFPDTGVYLAQALDFRGDPSRPPYYSLFVLPIHFRTTLWPVVLVQAAIATWVLYLTLRTVNGSSIPPRYLLGMCCFLSALSSLPWHVGQVLPDVFSGVLILAVYATAFGWKQLSMVERCFIGLILVLATLFHYSHLPLLAMTGGASLVFASWSRYPLRSLRTPSLVLITASAVAIAGFVTYSYAYTGRPSLSPDGNKFLLARLIGDGTAISYLHQVCPDAPYVLCFHLNEIGADHNAFLWNTDSPWRHVEHELGFNGARAEAARIVKGTIGAFPAKQFQKSLENFLTQLSAFATADTLCPCVGDDRVNLEIAKHFAREHSSYVKSLQSVDRLPTSAVRTIHKLTTIAALLGCLGLVIRPYVWGGVTSRLSSRALALLATTLFGLLTNGAVTGILSGSADRYQSRVIWLITFVFLVVAFPSAPSAARCSSTDRAGRCSI